LSYDADEIIARMRADPESDWPWRLLNGMAKRPLVDEAVIGVTRPPGGFLRASEKRVLEAASHGLTFDMIADVLGIGRETVKTELRSARYRLKAKNTAHACSEAIRRGLIR